MNLLMRGVAILLCLQACTGKKDTNNAFSEGALTRTLEQRGLTEADLLAAVKTYQPSGVHDDYLAFFGTGTSGRLAVMALPSMKVLKYVGVFSNEPWQGFGFDNESRRMLRESGRDEIEYHFGDSLVPALSQSAGKHDGRAVFLSDAAHGRIGMVDLREYETRQILTHPLFAAAHPSLVVDGDTRYVMQVTANPQTPRISASTRTHSAVSGATFWRFEEDTSKAYAHKTTLLKMDKTFAVFLPAGLSSDPVMGKGASANLAYVLSKCFRGRLHDRDCASPDESILYVIDWKKLEAGLSPEGPRPGEIAYWTYENAAKAGAVWAWSVAAASERAVISPNGEKLVLTQRTGSDLSILDLKDVNKVQPAGSSPSAAPELMRIGLGGPSVDAAFLGETTLFVSALNPGRIAKIDVSASKVVDQLDLGFDPSRLMLPLSDATSGETVNYLTVVNPKPHGRYTATGPILGWNLHLVDLGSEKLTSLYDQSISQTTGLGGVAMRADVGETVFKYKIGTDPRAGMESPFKTMPGQERVVREGNRVHMFGTVVRSRITPDYFEAEQGDLSDQRRTGARPNSRFHGRYLQRPRKSRARQNGLLHFRRRPCGGLPYVLHRILFGASPRDAGVFPRETLVAQSPRTSPL